MISIKHIFSKLPVSLGSRLNVIPFKYRFGRKYDLFNEQISFFSKASHNQKLDFIYSSFQNIVDSFQDNVFFKQLINVSNVSDYSDLPLLNKAHYKGFDVVDRTNFKYAMSLYNTGGTSGSPLSFYLEKGYYAREWSHMHYLWSRIGYKHTDVKITIRGKNINGLYKYNFNQNEFLINAYLDFSDSDYDKLLSVFKRYNTKFIHGYPSAIYSFIKKVEHAAPKLLDFLRSNIKGIMFGSEYPLPVYRLFIESRLTENSISWYGHTESVILAGELYQKYEYVPFLSYGFAEAVKVEDSYHLVGTCFSNLATPFIRYDTEDLIDPCFSNNGLLESFKIKEGRIGEFIVDKNGNLISITGLIFGRHHELFNYIDHLQVLQPQDGKLIVYFSSKNEIHNPGLLFDSQGVLIDFVFEQYDEPKRTKLGKVPILIT